MENVYAPDDNALISHVSSAPQQPIPPGHSPSQASHVINLERQLVVYDPLRGVLVRVERFLQQDVVVNDDMGLMIDFLCK